MWLKKFVCHSISPIQKKTLILPVLLVVNLTCNLNIVFFFFQVVRQEFLVSEQGMDKDPTFKPQAPREKWLKRRTTIKLKVIEY